MSPSVSAFFPAYNDAGTIASLAIVAHMAAREIVDRHRGRIEVQSEGVPGKGAQFSVWLPAEPAAGAG